MVQSDRESGHLPLRVLWLTRILPGDDPDFTSKSERIRRSKGGLCGTESGAFALDCVQENPEFRAVQSFGFSVGRGHFSFVPYSGQHMGAQAGTHSYSERKMHSVFRLRQQTHRLEDDSNPVNCWMVHQPDTLSTVIDAASNYFGFRCHISAFGPKID
jgi:hypothetical protein